MAFTEALRLVIDADTRGAVQGVEKLGATADRELSRSEKSLDAWGNRLTKVGTGMVAFGAAAVVGLGALAMESEQANLAQVKLQNTLDNMPKLAGASASEFTDLAESIQKVTAADADAIVEAEALLGTFNLTADEIKGITPLVVDYARKFGVDMADAAVQVGKALDGQVGALKRNGVSIDEALFATDRYRAVQEALSDQVGGFAEAEGKTFAGSLARMKNELGDLAEGVGGGAVDAFTTLFGAVDKVAGALESISPGTQETIGKIATFGAVGLIAAGGVSTLIGQVIKARENFSAAAEGVSAMTTRLGGLRSAAGLAAGAAGLLGLVLVAKQIGDASDDLHFDKLAAGLNSTTEAARTGTTEVIRILEGMGKLEEAFDGVLEQSVPAAESFIRTAESIGVESDKIDELRTKLEEKKAADVGASASQAEYSEEVQAGADAMDGATDSTAKLTSAVQAYASALSAQFDPLFGMISAQESLKNAQLDVADAQSKLNDAMAGGDPTAIAEAQRDYDSALGQSSDALFGVQQAQLRLNDAIQRGDVDLEEAQGQMFDWAIQAGFTADQALVMAGQLGGAADQARILGEQDPTVAVSITGVGPVTGDLNALKSKLDAIPREVNIITRLQQIVTGSTNIPLRAHGGPVEAGRAYIVGERQPELFVPNRSGTIVPSVGGMGGGGTSVTYQLVFNAPTNDQQVIEAIKRFERNNGPGWRN